MEEKNNIIASEEQTASIVEDGVDENPTASLVSDNKPVFKPNRAQKRKFFAGLRRARKAVVHHEIYKSELKNKVAKRRRQTEIADASRKFNRNR